MPETSSIRGKVVAVTGAGGGIGAAIASDLASRGAHLVIGGRSADRLERVADSLGHWPDSRCVSARIDVRSRADMVRFVDLALAEHGQLDVLVSNAGAMPISPLDDLRVDDWEEMVDTNVKGLLFGIAAALPLFRSQQSGHFVNIASSSGLTVRPNMAVYAGTKFAVRAISEGLRQEAGPDLRVSVVSPGFTMTDGVGRGVANATVRSELHRNRDAFAMEPEAVARAVAFAIEQPPNVDVNEIVVRPTAQA